MSVSEEDQRAAFVRIPVPAHNGAPIQQYRSPSPATNLLFCAKTVSQTLQDGESDTSVAQAWFRILFSKFCVETVSEATFLAPHSRRQVPHSLLGCRRRGREDPGLRAAPGGALACHDREGLDPGPPVRLRAAGDAVWLWIILRAPWSALGSSMV